MRHQQIKFTGDMKKAAETTPRWWVKKPRTKYQPHEGQKQLRRELERAGRSS